jgi:phage-related protein
MSSPYHIALEIALHDGASSGIAGIARQMLGLQGSVDKVTKGFDAIKIGILGVASVMAGGAILHGMGGIVDKGNELVRVQQAMKLAGVDALQVQEATNKAWEQTGKYLNVSSVDVLKMINDSRMIYGDQVEATHKIEPFVRSAAILKAINPEKGGEHADAIRGEMFAAIKSGELAGKLTTKEMGEHVDHLTAMKVAFGEQISISQYLTAQRAAGVSMRNVDDNFRYGVFPALVQENGVNAGTMLMSAYNKVVAGVGWRTKAAEEGVNFGLIDPKQVEYAKSGHIKGLTSADAIRGNKLAAVNPLTWTDQVLAPLMANYIKKRKIHDPLHKKIAEGQEISRLFPDRNVAKTYTELLQQSKKLHKDESYSNLAYKSVASGGDEYLQKNLDYQQQAFHAQWKGFLVALGSPLVPAAAASLASINKAMAGVTAWASVHPDAIQAIGIGLASLATGLVSAGAIMVGGVVVSALAMAGPLVLAIGGIASAVVGLGAVLWSALPGEGYTGDGTKGEKWLERRRSAMRHGDGILAQMWNGLSDKVASVPDIASGAVARIATTFQHIGGGLSAAVDGVINAGTVVAGRISAAFPQIMASIIGGIQAVPDLAGGALQRATSMLQAIREGIPAAIGGLADGGGNAISAVVASVSRVATGVWQTIETLGAEIAKAVPQLATNVAKALPALASELVATGAALATAIGAVIGRIDFASIWDAVAATAKAGAEAVKGQIAGAWDFAKTLPAMLATSIAAVGDGIAVAVQNLPAVIAGASGIVGRLISSGLATLWDAAKSAAESGAGLVRGIAMDAWGFIKTLPATIATSIGSIGEGLAASMQGLRGRAVAAISGMMQFALEGAKGALAGAKDWAVGMFPGLGGMFENIQKQITAGLSHVQGLAMTGLSWVQDGMPGLGEGILAAFDGVRGFLSNAVGGLYQWFTGMAPNLSGAFASFGGIASQVAAALGAVKDRLLDGLVALPGFIGRAIPHVLNTLQGALTGLIRAVPVVIPRLIGGITQGVALINQYIPVVVDKIVSLLPKVVGFIATAMPKIMAVVIGAIPGIVAGFAKIAGPLAVGLVKIGAVLAWEIAKAVPQIVWGVGKELAKLGIELAKTGPAIVAAAISSAGAQTWEAVKGAWAWTKDIGTQAGNAIKSIGAEFISAIQSLPGQVAGAISSAISGIGAKISAALASLNPFGAAAPAPAAPAAGVQQQSAPVAPAVPNVTKASFVPQVAPVMPKVTNVSNVTKQAVTPAAPSVPKITNVVPFAPRPPIVAPQVLPVAYRDKQPVAPVKVPQAPASIVNVVNKTQASPVKVASPQVKVVPEIPQVAPKVTNVSYITQGKQPASVVVPEMPRQQQQSVTNVLNTTPRQQISPVDGVTTRQPRPQTVTVNTTVVSMLDGRKVAQSVTQRQVDAMRYQSSVGPQDNRGTWASPSAQTGVAV